MKSKISLEELLKLSIITCGKCGGKLQIIPYKEKRGKNSFVISTINICEKCSFEKK